MENTVKCEICREELEANEPVFFAGDVCVNPKYIEHTNVFCTSCAKENDLI